MSMSDELNDEIELLKAMYSEDELIVDLSGTNVKLTAKLLPCTAGNEEMQFSWCELHFFVGPNYPGVPPVLELGSSRGLSDACRSKILQVLEGHMEQLNGEPVLCALIEVGKEALTDLNGTSCECTICLSAITKLSPDGSESDKQVVRFPCFHVFHRCCAMDYCKSELARQQVLHVAAASTAVKILCPECRADIPWEDYAELKSQFSNLTESNGTSNCSDTPGSELESDLREDCLLPACTQTNDTSPLKDSCSVTQTNNASPLKDCCSVVPEAFVRLHHLWQGNDEKEKPLLRLLKELGLNARVYYGKPALLHIQGFQKDVDSFAGIAKRRHITVTIDVAQRSSGPPIACGIMSIPAKKGSLDSSTLHKHLEQRGLSETSFTILGS